MLLSREISIGPGSLEVNSQLQSFQKCFGLLVVRFETRHIDIATSTAELGQFIFELIQLIMCRFEIRLKCRHPPASSC